MSAFLLEYYKRIKEPMPEDIQELANAAAASNDSENNGKGKKKAKQQIGEFSIHFESQYRQSWYSQKNRFTYFGLTNIISLP